ncbi:hypothetical protein ACFOEK_06370 [Litoribrevibacter euphylliae]|uniref:Uncharacterized protein n=1 Tax=Litoribrevibacter euphylliae TaxID=1834034 RepID=A0ABV7HH17_9GAMM
MSSFAVVFMGFVILSLVAGIALLFWRFNQIQTRVNELEKSLSQEVVSEFLPHLRLVIHEPHIVAQRESKLAKAVSAVSPEYIKYRVYKQVATELELALNERDIDVSIELVGMRGGASKNTKSTPDDQVIER